jgi:pyridoxamine 5'-phosphate oxidase
MKLRKDMKKTKGKRDNYENILNEVWAMLQRGVTHFRDPFHWPALGTVGEGDCNLRTVILRQFILPDRILVCHTDSRATKAKEILDTNRTSWLFYHPKKMIQLRIKGQTTLHTDDPFAEDQWAATRITSRLNYCAAHAPGTPVEKPSSGLSDFLLNKIPTLFETARGRKYFMVITCRIDSLDWLMLSVGGNRRARFDWEDNNLRATWLIP